MRVMKTIRKIFLLTLLFAAATVHAQTGITAVAAYRYLNAPNWDNIIRTYNFMRPWNTKLQPLLTHGWEIGGGYRKTFGKLVGEGRLTYAHCGSRAVNGTERFKIAINAFDLHAGIQVHPLPLIDSRNEDNGRGLFVEIDPTLSLLLPSVRENGKQVELLDEKGYHPLSVAFLAGVSAGYDFLYKLNTLISPFARVQWYPSAQLRDFASAVNGSYFTDLSNKSSAVIFSAGVHITLLSQ